MRVIICGGRDYRLTEDDEEFLFQLNINAEMHFQLLLSGGCDGADKDAEEWAKKNLIPIKQFIPDWVAKGKSAGPLRNEEMAKEADCCIAFPGGKGTEDMIKRARAHNLLTIIVPKK